MKNKTEKKVFYLDVETTGVNWWENDIIQLAYLIEINGEIVCEKNLKAKPTNWNTISEEALKVTGNTIESLKELPDQSLMYKELSNDFATYVDKFDKFDKFYPAGYNVQFDLYFLEEFFRRNKDNYLGSFLNWKRLDPLPILYIMDFNNKISFENYKLSTICKVLNIELNAHDALSDIKATREVLNKLLEMSKQKNKTK